MDYAKKAIQAEAMRKGAINRGMLDINAVFGGGTVPTYMPATGSFDRNQAYYSIDKHTGEYHPFYEPGYKNEHGTQVGALRGVAFGAAIGGDRAPTWKHKVNKQLANNTLFFKGSDKTYGGFTPSFFDARKQAYIDYAQPQLAAQFRNTQQQVAFGLANRGLLGGSVQQQKGSEIVRANQAGERQIVDAGTAQSQQLQQQVEAERQKQIGFLYTSADPAQAMQSAISTAASLRQPSTFAPLANAFGNIANTVAMSRLYNPSISGNAPTNAPGYGSDSGALPPVSGIY